MTNHRSSRTLVGVLLVAGGLAVTGQCWLFRTFTVDDAFITFRYSRNLASGSGLVYNSGLAAAEGYSSFLWTIFLAVPQSLGLAVEHVAKGLGVSFALLVLAATYALARRLCEGRDHSIAGGCAAAGATALGAYHATAVHAVSGMETMLVALLLTLFTSSAIGCVRARTTGSIFRVTITALLLGLSRPEMNLVVLVVFVLVLVHVSRERTKLFRAILFGYLVPGFAYYLWRYHTYGLAFPLPFYVKALSSRFPAGLTGTTFFWGAMAARFGLLLILALASGITASLRIALAVVGTLSLVFLVPEGIMNFDSRYLYPSAPIIAAIAARGLESLARSIPNPAGSWRLPAGLALGWLAVSSLAGLRDARVSLREKNAYARGMASAHVPLGEALRDFARANPESRPLLVIGDAGAVPYLSGWTTIDSFGLNDARIATTGNHDPTEMLAASPDLVVVISKKAETFTPTLPWESELLIACESRGLRRIATLEFGDQYFLWCLTMPEHDVAEYLQRRFGQEGGGAIVASRGARG